MSVKIRPLILLLILCGFLKIVDGFAGDIYPFNNANDQRRFNQLTTQFRCLVCQNEDLASSNALLARDLRNQIYHMVRNGKSTDSIIQYMRDRYGDFVRFQPPFVMRTWILWLAPFVLWIVGMLVICLVVARYRKKTIELSPTEKQDLQDILR